ncbi:hypothetical protein [Motiliproteus sp. MSK22-1]|uniref:hypothetical protein n=1 Tax=Motiliproteus sp. MSK22-1 TaxID=1897630 RepID=UPI000975EB22|nr:hypothetical protein [Motiliproteus sp. MSK22-1]OMH37957.1 hypothetical protein BGP75_06625 [Motiliproteus sp. MSK22-1]
MADSGNNRVTIQCQNERCKNQLEIGVSIARKYGSAGGGLRCANCDEDKGFMILPTAVPAVKKLFS